MGIYGHAAPRRVPRYIYILYGVILVAISLLIHPNFFKDLVGSGSPIETILDDNAIFLIGTILGTIYLCLGRFERWRNLNTDRSVKFGAIPAILVGLFLLVNSCDGCARFVPLEIPYELAFIVAIYSLIIVFCVAIPFLIRGLIQGYKDRKDKRNQNSM